jgi:beta-1,4-mannosyltransferase
MTDRYRRDMSAERSPGVDPIPGFLPKLRVLHSAPDPKGTASYVSLISLDPDAGTDLFFSWKTALTGRYSVFHIHWPEVLVRGKGKIRTGVQRVLCLLLLARLALLRIPVVRTLHNPDPHEAGSSSERAFLNLIDRRTLASIRLNPYTPQVGSEPSTLIPHARYSEAYEGFPRAARVAGRLLYFGMVRPYKGVEGLIEVFQRMNPEASQLRIVGRADADLASQIHAVETSCPRISSDLSFVSDEQLVAEISASSLVVLPYRRMHNSGAILAALSVGRPVLAPRTLVNEWLQEEVGEDFLHLYDGELSSEILRESLEGSERVMGEPNLIARDRASTLDKHLAVYRAARLSMKRKGR